MEVVILRRIRRIDSVRHREVIPEILDSLPPDDREGQRSRRELRYIDVLMGNSRWILSRLPDPRSGTEVHELGAGDGCLLGKIAARGFSSCGYDLAPRPGALTGAALWERGNFLEREEPFRGVVAGSLILHHLEEKELQSLGKRLRVAERLLFVEPLRSHLALGQGYALLPFLGPVTRHDMIVSIRAGFRPGDLPLALGLPKEWKVEETTTARGGYRLMATRG